MALKKAAKKRVVKKAVAASGSVKAPAKKRVAKKAATAASSVTTSAVALLEKELSAAQTKLGKAYERETAQCVKEVAKLKMQLEKALARQTLQRERKAAAIKSQSEKPTNAAKARVAGANKTLQATGTAIKDIRAALQSARSAHAEASKAQKKFTAMEKLLAGFERDWLKAASKPRKIVRRVRKPAAPVAAS